MFGVYLLRFLAVVVFLYLAWKKVRDDFGDDRNSFLWSGVLAFLIGGRLIWSVFNLVGWNVTVWDWLFFWNKPGFSLMAGLVSLLLFVFIYCLFERYVFLEIVDDLVVPLLMLGILWMFSFGKVWLFANYWLVIGLILVYIFGFWAKRYRSFYWYKSGKKGFLFLCSGAFFWLYVFLVSFLVSQSSLLRYSALFMSLLFVISLVMLGELFDLNRRKK